MKKYLLLFFVIYSTVLVGVAQPKNAKTQKSNTKSAKASATKKKKRVKNDREEAENMKRNGVIKKPEVITKPSPMYAPIRRNGKMITGNISNVQGFRICIYNGVDRASAFKAKQQFMLEDSETPSYLSYSRPYYRIKVGNFTDKKTAQRTLKKLNARYPNAFIVPDIVINKNIEVRRIRSARTAKQ